MERKAEILLDLAREVNSYNGSFEDLVYTYKDLDELVEASKTFEREILKSKDEIIEEFLDVYRDSLEYYQKEWLEELGVDLDD